MSQLLIVSKSYTPSEKLALFKNIHPVLLLLFRDRTCYLRWVSSWTMFVTEGAQTSYEYPFFLHFTL